jgi:hypothetical protein
MLAASTSQSVHGLWTKTLPRLSGAQTVKAADAKASRRMTNAVRGNQRLLRNGYEEKSAESMNPRKLHLREAICPAPEGRLQPVRDCLVSGQRCRLYSCCPRRRRTAFVRRCRDGRGRRSRQSIAVCLVVRQTELCQATLQRAAPSRRLGIRPL